MDSKNVITAMLAPGVGYTDANLSMSPSQQTAAVLHPDEYAATDLQLLEAVAEPAEDLIEAVPQGLPALFEYIDGRLLGESPSAQLADLANVNTYLQTQTVLLENVAAPPVGVVDGSARC